MDEFESRSKLTSILEGGCELIGLTREETGDIRIALSKEKDMAMLVFVKTDDWDLSPFEKENELETMEAYNATSVPKKILSTYKILQKYTERSDLTVVHLVPRKGLGGVIVFDNIAVHLRRES